MPVLGRSIHVRGKGCAHDRRPTDAGLQFPLICLSERRQPIRESVMADALGSYPQFRLNFEQQGKRAKDLLKAARGGEAEALARFKSPPRLAEAQYLIARELRFDNWASMKRHIREMTAAREAMHASAPDSDLPTLHIRCGHDLQESLKEAGFGGDYYVDIYPYIIGPVSEGSG